MRNALGVDERKTSAKEKTSLDLAEPEIRLGRVPLFADRKAPSCHPFGRSGMWVREDMRVSQGEWRIRRS